MFFTWAQARCGENTSKVCINTVQFTCVTERQALHLDDSLIAPVQTHSGMVLLNLYHKIRKPEIRITFQCFFLQALLVRVLQNSIISHWSRTRFKFKSKFRRRFTFIVMTGVANAVPVRICYNANGIILQWQQ